MTLDNTIIKKLPGYWFQKNKNQSFFVKTWSCVYHIFVYMYIIFSCYYAADIASQYHISKYPTLKLVRNGQLIKKEYRGQRSVDSLVQFLKDQVRDSVQQHNTLESLDELNVSTYTIYTWFPFWRKKITYKQNLQKIFFVKYLFWCTYIGFWFSPKCINVYSMSLLYGISGEKETYNWIFWRCEFRCL